MTTEAQTVARTFFEHLVARDVDKLAALYTEDAVVWRNFDDRTLKKEQVVKLLKFLCFKAKKRDLRQYAGATHPNWVRSTTSAYR